MKPTLALHIVLAMGLSLALIVLWLMSQPIGMSDRAPDGVENVMLIRTGDEWAMIYSEGLADQHLAYAQSPDLLHWTIKGDIAIPVQSWMSARYGAPFIWREADTWLMLLMGEDAHARTRLGLFISTDALHWLPLPERIP